MQSTNKNFLTKFRDFALKKNVVISSKRYLISAMSNMAMGLFSTLLIGTIFKTLGTKLGINYFVTDIAPLAMSMTGPAIGVSVAYSLSAPNLVLFSSTIIGAFGYKVGGPVGSFVAAIIGVEFGKLISKETKLDIILTPFTTIMSGMIVGEIIGPPIAKFMTSFGSIIMNATEMQPFFMGVFVSTLVGIALTLPISSAAICIMLGLSGLAGGAATVGCSAQMVGFAVMSFRENKWGGLAAQGIGTSMLQMGNIVKNWKIWIPPTIASAILGPMSTIIFKMENSPLGSGMGTCGFVGQITTIETMGATFNVYTSILLLHFILPSIITLIVASFMRKKGYIKEGDLKLDL